MHLIGKCGAFLAITRIFFVLIHFIRLTMLLFMSLFAHRKSNNIFCCWLFFKQQWTAFTTKCFPIHYIITQFRDCGNKNIIWASFFFCLHVIIYCWKSFNHSTLKIGERGKKRHHLSLLLAVCFFCFIIVGANVSVCIRCCLPLGPFC